MSQPLRLRSSSSHVVRRRRWRALVMSLVVLVSIAPAAVFSQTETVSEVGGARESSATQPEGTAADVPSVSETASVVSQERGWKGYVTPLRRVRVPANDSGVLLVCETEPGRKVEAGDLLARLDRTQQERHAELTRSELRLAELRSSSAASRELDYAEALLAELDYLDSADLNGLAADQAEARRLRRLLLSPQREPLEKTLLIQRNQEAEIEAELKRIALRGAEDEIARGVIKAPCSGVVTQQFRQLGEWVQAGEAICELVAMDRLKVEVGVPVADVDVMTLMGRRCQLKIESPGGRIEIIESRVDRVSELINASGRVQIEAEFDNSEVDGVWRVLPGSQATLIPLPIE